jgi:hypothetical protein
VDYEIGGGDAGRLGFSDLLRSCNEHMIQNGPNIPQFSFRLFAPSQVGFSKTSLDSYRE